MANKKASSKEEPFSQRTLRKQAMSSHLNLLQTFSGTQNVLAHQHLGLRVAVKRQLDSDFENHTSILMSNHTSRSQEDQPFFLSANSSHALQREKQKIATHQQTIERALRMCDVAKQQLEQQLRIADSIRSQKAQRENMVQLIDAKIAKQSKGTVQQQAAVQTSMLQTKSFKDRITVMYNSKKHMNNQLQTLKGNIRVFCRIRHKSQFEEQLEQESYFTANNGTLTLKLPKEALKSQNHKRDFTYQFEQVFNDIPQSTVFQGVSPLIESVLDGKNVCIFAYGQTGSGKTYTMQGGEGETMGIVPRSIRHLFQEIENNRVFSLSYNLSIQCAEIYNDDVRDIFVKDVDRTGKFVSFKVNNEEDVNHYLKIAEANRVVAGTNCNQRSSRSHLIFTIKVQTCRESPKVTTESSMNLIDLAGSQRVNVSKVEGDRYKETKSINLSLCTLSQVIGALAKKSSHVPFRNSKLTQFMQPFLSGDSKIAMMVCISPLVRDFQQTQCSLQFAQNVKKVVLQKAGSE